MLRPMQLTTLAGILLLCGNSAQAKGILRALDAEDAVDGDVTLLSSGAAVQAAAYDVDCKVGEWEIVKDCGETSCNQIVQRSVLTAPSGRGTACPSLVEMRPCASVDCVWSWGPWEACGADGYKFRTLSVTTPSRYGGRACPASLVRVKCSPLDCLLSSWSEWACNATSGNKTHTRTVVREPKLYGATCPPLQETKPCDPVDCEVKTAAEDTGPWSLCQYDGSSTGYQTKVLGIKTKPLYNGKACPPPTHPSRIATQACTLPVPGTSTRNVTAVLDILAYSDVYELLQDSVNGLNVGGPSRVVPVANQMRAKNPNSLVLFSGDTMSPSLWSSQFKGMQMVDAHNAIGVDFASLGNHEFDFGVEAFLNVSSGTHFPWLNANCYEAATGKLLRGTTEFATKTFTNPVYGNITIGFFGVMYEMKDTSKGLYWTDPIEAAKVQVAKLKALNVDMIIALTHQELADDNRLSKEVAGIHLIYGGHDHASMLQTNYGTPYLKSDFDFRSVWKSRIEFFKKTDKLASVFRMEHTAVPIIQEMPSDKALDTIISDYSAKIGTMFARVVGTLCKPLDLTQRVVRTQDAPIAHIFTNAILEFYGPGAGDVVVQNGGAIRTNTVYPAGTFTMAQVVAWSPFGNTIIVVQTNGASLKKFITREMVGSCDTNTIMENGLYVHTAGVKYTFTCTGYKTGSVTSLEWINQPTRTGAVLDTDTFKLVLNDFLYTSEFTVIPGVTYTTLVKPVEAQRVDEALEKYVKKMPSAILCEDDATVRTSVSFATATA